MIFCEESFPTDIRASATGARAKGAGLARLSLPLSLGRRHRDLLGHALVGVLSPATDSGALSAKGGRGPGLCEGSSVQVGEPGFLALAAAAFLVSAVCVLPLQAASVNRKTILCHAYLLLFQETHRAELKDMRGSCGLSESSAVSVLDCGTCHLKKDFVEEDGENFEEGEAEAAEAAEEESELSEGETDTVGGATTVSSQEPTSVAFADGTLGAALELKLVFFLLGAVPGVSFTAFYSSMGFLIDRCRDRSFFAQACPESLRVRPRS